MANQSEVKNFQRSLNEDVDEKNRFINAEVEESDEDSESEGIRIVAPKKTKKRSQIDTMLMEQLIAQQKAYLKAQKTIYKLRNEIDTEEVKTRYIKLDLNNAQVKVDELTLSQKEYRNKYYTAYTINIGCLVFYVLWLFCNIFVFDRRY
jgi:hypothetical protein